MSTYQSVVGVDPNCAGPEPVGHLNRGVEVAGVDRSSQSVCGAVADLENLLLGLELGDGADWAEDLLLYDLHVLGDIGEDGWLDEVALVALALTADLDLGASVLAGLDVAVTMSVGDLLRVGCYTYPMMRSNWIFDTCGPWKVFSANGSPTTFFDALSLNLWINLS